MTLGREDDPEPSSPEYEGQASRTMIEPEHVPDELLIDPDDSSTSKRLIVSVDFGTTYSAVSYIALSENQRVDHINSRDIRSIENYPGDKNPQEGSQMKKEVPTEVMYPLDPQFRSRANLSCPVNTRRSVTSSDDEPARNGADAMEIDGTGYNISMMMSESRDFKWGYRMHEAWGRPATHFKQTSKAMNRFKLLLDQSPATQNVRDNLRSTLKHLISKKIVESEVGVIADFLTCLLRHAKSQLQLLRLYDGFEVEMVLCVPAIWTQKACRDMQMALLIAMKMAEFNGVDPSYDAIENLFIVSEPEAAAAFILDTEPDIQAGETFVLLDAGGGTVDANTYTISQTQPLRLSDEVVEPGGGLCGSSYLNEAFRALLHKRLKAEKQYLERGRITLDGIIEDIIINKFEYITKRQFDLYDDLRVHERYYCANLEDDADKGFWDSEIIVNHDEMRDIFIPCLENIAAIMEDQIVLAMGKGVHVDQVILVGGFAGSPSLHGYLERHLATLSNRLGFDVELFRPRNNANSRVTAVASGAVLRALNKENGPGRQIQCSYGIRRDESKGTQKEHRNAKAFRDRADEDEPRFLCEEHLYVSDSATESHYSLTSRRNKSE
ncbi:peptide transporter ptr2 [Hypoxylon texense]